MSIIAENTRRIIKERGLKIGAVGKQAGYQGKTFYNLLSGSKVITDNGVLYDADKDWADTLSMVEAGLLKPELALAKKYDLPSETPEDLAAIREKYMPEMVQLTAQAGLR